MPSNEVDLIIDADTGELYRDTSCRLGTNLGSLGPWRAGWTYSINMLIVRKDRYGIPMGVTIPGDTTLKIGRAGASMGVGSVTFAFGGTSVTIDADELDAQRLEAELNGIPGIRSAGKVSVTGGGGNYQVVFREPGDVSLLTVTPDLLPTATGTVEIVQGGTATIREKLSIRMVEDYSASGGAPAGRPAPTAGVTVQQDGAELRHVEIIDIDEYPSGGSFTYSHTTALGQPVSIDSTAAEFEALLTDKSVDRIGSHRWRITWDSVGTATTGTTDSSGIEYFSAITCILALTGGQLYATLGSGRSNMVMEIGETDGEIYFSEPIHIGRSLGDMVPEGDSFIRDTDGNIITDSDGNPI